MTRVQYFTACTLDGFIADENQSLDWLFEAPHGEDEGGWDEFVRGVGPMTMGATTYEWMLQRHDMLTNPQQWRDFYADRPCWVFSHRDLPPIPTVDIRIVSGDIRPVYDEMVTTLPGKNIWILGGGDLVGQFDDAGLLDEVWFGDAAGIPGCRGTSVAAPHHDEAADAPRRTALRPGDAADLGRCSSGLSDEVRYDE